MKKIITSTLLFSLALVGCQTGGIKNIFHTPNSKSGRSIARLGSAQELYQARVRAYQAAMINYEEKKTGEKRHIYYSSVVGPKEVLSPTQGVYKLQGAYRKGEYLNYKAIVTFEDEDLTVIKNIEIAEKLDNK